MRGDEQCPYEEVRRLAVACDEALDEECQPVARPVADVHRRGKLICEPMLEMHPRHEAPVVVHPTAANDVRAVEPQSHQD